MRLYLNNIALFEGEVNKFFKQYEDKQTKYALQVGMGPFVHPSYITDKHKPFLSDVIISELNNKYTPIKISPEFLPASPVKDSFL